MNREEKIFKYKKKVKEVSLARAAVESYVNSVMPETGLAYSLQYVENGIILKIKLQYRRMIRVRINYLNYVEMIAKLRLVIQLLKDSFDSLGNMYIRVTNYSSDEKWIEPSEEPQEENELLM